MVLGYGIICGIIYHIRHLTNFLPCGNSDTESLEEKADEELAVVAGKDQRATVEFNLGGVAPLIYQPPPDGHRKVMRCCEKQYASNKNCVPTVPNRNLSSLPFDRSLHCINGTLFLTYMPTIRNPSSYLPQMSFGGRPMWSHFAFVDIFVDAFLAKGHSHYQNMSSAPPGVMGLSSALLFVTSVLKSLESDVDRGQGSASQAGMIPPGSAKVVQKLSSILDECANMCNLLTMATGDANRLYEAVLQMVLKLKMLREGECMVLPGGWSCTEPAQYHIVLYVVAKLRKDGRDVFNFTVVNTGAGLEHHLQVWGIVVLSCTSSLQPMNAYNCARCRFVA